MINIETTKRQTNVTVSKSSIWVEMGPVPWELWTRPIPLWRLYLLRFVDSNFPEISPWTWELNPLNLRLWLSKTLLHPEYNTEIGAFDGRFEVDWTKQSLCLWCQRLRFGLLRHCFRRTDRIRCCTAKRAAFLVHTSWFPQARHVLRVWMQQNDDIDDDNDNKDWTR